MFLCITAKTLNIFCRSYQLSISWCLTLRTKTRGALPLTSLALVHLPYDISVHSCTSLIHDFLGCPLSLLLSTFPCNCCLCNSVYPFSLYAHNILVFCSLSFSSNYVAVHPVFRPTFSRISRPGMRRWNVVPDSTSTDNVGREPLGLILPLIRRISVIDQLA